MPNLKPIEIILILVVIVLLFGAKRLPDAARGLGRSLRIFKAETKGLRDDEETPDTTTVQQVAPQPLPASPPNVPEVPAPTQAAQPQPAQAPPAAPTEPGTPSDR